MRFLVILFIVILALGLVGGVLAGASSSVDGVYSGVLPTFNVNSALDTVDANPGNGVCLTAGGVCTLRAAVMESNALPGADAIALPAGQYVRTIGGVGENGAATGDLDITESVSILGADSLTTIIDANGLDRVFEIIGTTPVTVVFESVTIREGFLSSGFDGGGGVRVDANGRLTLSNSRILDNEAWGDGGGIENFGRLMVVNSLIDGNTLGSVTGYGGGLSTDGQGVSLVVDSDVTGNDGRFGGGAATWFDAVLTVTNSLFSGNSGSAVYIMGKTAVFDSQLTNNLPHSSGFEVGTIRVDSQGELYVEGSTIGFGQESAVINYNRAVISGSVVLSSTGAGIFTDDYLELRNSLVQGNTGTGVFGGAGSGGGDVFIINSVIRNNQTTDQYGNLSSGGGIYNGGDTRLRVISSAIQSNVADEGWGGGIFARGPMTITGSVIEDNSAFESGGGLYFSDLGSVIARLAVVERTLFQNNQAGDEGGGVFSQSYNGFYVNQSTFSNNEANSNGGGMSMWRLGTVVNSTFGENDSGGFGGGLYQEAFSEELISLNNVTLYLNEAADGNALSGGNMTVNNSIAAGVDGNNCQGTITSIGHNLDSGGSCGFNESGDVSFVMPVFGPLQNNGGPTPTYGLLPGSPAVDGGANGSCEAVDQRGFGRPFDGDGVGGAVCDMGAYEYGAADMPEIAVFDTSVLEGDVGTTTAVFTVTLSKAAAQLLTVDFTTVEGTAEAGEDYVGTAGFAVFNPGVTAITIPVTILGDMVSDPNEVFYLALSLPSQGYVIRPVGVGSIVDNEPVIYLPVVMKAE